MKTKAVALATGATERQLQWMRENKVLKIAPDGRGHPSDWTQDDALEVGIAAHLRKKGLHYTAIRVVLKQWRAQWTEYHDAQYLLTDGKTVTLHDVPEVVMHNASTARSGVYLVDLEGIRVKLHPFAIGAAT